MILFLCTPTATLMRKYLRSEERYGSNRSVGVPRGRTSVLNNTHGMICPSLYCDVPLYEASFGLNSTAMSHVIIQLWDDPPLWPGSLGWKLFYDIIGGMPYDLKRACASRRARLDVPVARTPWAPSAGV